MPDRQFTLLVPGATPGPPLPSPFIYAGYNTGSGIGCVGLYYPLWNTSGTGNPLDVCTDGTYAYFISPGSGYIGRINLNTFVVNYPFINLGGGYAITTDGTYLYIATGGGLYRYTMAGVAAPATQPWVSGFPGSVGGPGTICHDGTYLYLGDANWPNGHNIWRVPLAGGPPTTLATLSGFSPTYGIAVDSQYVFYTGRAGGGTYALGRMNRDGTGANNAFCPGLTGGSVPWGGIVTDGVSNVYLMATQANGNNIYVTSRSTGTTASTIMPSTGAMNSCNGMRMLSQAPQ